MGADLTDAAFEESDLTGANLLDSDLTMARFRGCRMDPELRPFAERHGAVVVATPA